MNVTLMQVSTEYMKAADNRMRSIGCYRHQ